MEVLQMKFYIDRHILLDPLDQISKALPSKSIMPILNEILFKADNEGLTIIGGDSTTYIKAVIPSDNFELVREGSITLPGRKIVEIIKGFSTDISFEINGTKATIKSGKSKFELAGMDAEEYPRFPEVNGQSFKLPGAVLKNLIQKTIFATSEKSETPILMGVYFQLTESGIKLTACDRHRLSKLEHEVENNVSMEVVISSDSLGELMKLLSDKSEVVMSIEQNKFLAITKGYSFSSSILEGAYPDTERMVPTVFQSLVTVNTKGMINALERVYIIAREEKANIITMSFSGAEVEIVAKVKDNGNASESVEILKKDGVDFILSLNARYLIEALKTISADNAIIHYVGEMKPLVIKGENEENNLQLALPFRTQKEDFNGKTD
jgi:DNA polymerase III subunit beta